jgi:hypothetical protein
MKRTNTLYLISLIFFVTILISLYIDISETFTLSLNNRVLNGTFTNSCENCRLNESNNNNSRLICTCLNNRGQMSPSSLVIDNKNLTRLPSLRIQNMMNGQLAFY